MVYDPLPHQHEDSTAMVERKHALLFADAGTGKTVTIMEAIKKGGYHKTVVVCPPNAITMWIEEIERHLKVRAYALRSGRVTKKGGVMDCRVLVTTPDLVGKHHNLIRSFIRGGPKNAALGEGKKVKRVLVLDEAHLFKNRDAMRTRRLFSNFDTRGNPTTKLTADGRSLASDFDDVWWSTGTPITRHADDLWTCLRTLRPDVLVYYGVLEYHKFVDKFCTTKLVKYSAYGQTHKVVTGSKNVDLLNQVLWDSYAIKRSLSDVVDDLPPITIGEYAPHLSQKVNCPKIDIKTLAKALSDKDSEMATARRMLGVAKVAGIMEYLDLYGDPPLLIGYWHKDVGDELGYALKGKNVARVDGATSQAKRDLIRSQFNNGEIDYLLGQMQAMNTAWNLQGVCKNVVIAEELPSPALLHQFYSRVYRRGQKNHVHVTQMTSTHKLDVAMSALRGDKKDVLHELFGEEDKV